MRPRNEKKCAPPAIFHVSLGNCSLVLCSYLLFSNGSNHLASQNQHTTETQQPLKPKEHNVIFFTIPTPEEETKKAEQIAQFIARVAAFDPHSNEFISQIIGVTYSMYSKHYHPQVWIVFYSAILNSKPDK